jgi:hypothetical protein
MAWTADELSRLSVAEELEITSARADGTLRSWTPIWVVVADGQVYVRTWHRRDTGWFGRAVRSGRARVRVPGVELDVRVDDLGASGPGRGDVDAAYLHKYGRYGSGTVQRMVTDEAVAATLRLQPDRPIT